MSGTQGDGYGQVDETTARPMTAAELRERAAAISRDAEAMRREAAKMDRAAEEARRPRMPQLRDGAQAIVSFNKLMNGTDYLFAAVGFRKGHNIRWTVTGQETRRFTWQGLLSWVGEANWSTMFHLTDGTPIGPEPGQEPPVAEVMAPFGRVTRTESVGTNYGVQVDSLTKMATFQRAYGNE